MKVAEKYMQDNESGLSQFSRLDPLSRSAMIALSFEWRSNPSFAERRSAK
jgi:hypothetical protein